jgi:hypothetical protein
MADLKLDIVKKTAGAIKDAGGLLQSGFRSVAIKSEDPLLRLGSSLTGYIGRKLGGAIDYGVDYLKGDSKDDPLMGDSPKPKIKPKSFPTNDPSDAPVEKDVDKLVKVSQLILEKVQPTPDIDKNIELLVRISKNQEILQEDALANQLEDRAEADDPKLVIDPRGGSPISAPLDEKKGGIINNILKLFGLENLGFLDILGLKSLLTSSMGLLKDLFVGLTAILPNLKKGIPALLNMLRGLAGLGLRSIPLIGTLAAFGGLVYSLVDYLESDTEIKAGIDAMSRMMSKLSEEERAGFVESGFSIKPDSISNEEWEEVKRLTSLSAKMQREETESLQRRVKQQKEREEDSIKRGMVPATRLEINSENTGYTSLPERQMDRKLAEQTELWNLAKLNLSQRLGIESSNEMLNNLPEIDGVKNPNLMDIEHRQQSMTSNFSSPLMKALSETETGRNRGDVDDPSRFIRTKVSVGGGQTSTAYGPFQITKLRAKDAIERNIVKDPEVINWMKTRFIPQGEKMIQLGENDPKYGLGKSGDLNTPKDREMYMRMAGEMLQQAWNKSGGRTFNFVKDWYGHSDRKELVRYNAKFSSALSRYSKSSPMSEKITPSGQNLTTADRNIVPPSLAPAPSSAQTTMGNGGNNSVNVYNSVNSSTPTPTPAPESITCNSRGSAVNFCTQ